VKTESVVNFYEILLYDTCTFYRSRVLVRWRDTF